MIIVINGITTNELKKIAKKMFGDLIKIVVDIKREIMAVGGELHSDEEALLIEDGSQQEDLWGINIYPEIHTDDWIEFDSIINIRPSQGYYTRSIEEPEIKKQIVKIVNNLVKNENLP